MTIRLDTVLVLGLVLLPFTALRVGIVGPGEVLVALFAILLLLSGRLTFSKRFSGAEFSTFWAVFIFAISLGALWNLISSRPTSTFEKTLFDLGSYVFIAASFAALESARRAGILDIHKISFRWIAVSAFLVLFLFQVAQVSPSFLGAPLFYFDKFVPWADNPHQITTSFIPMIFIGLHISITNRKRLVKAVSLLSVCVLLICTIGTGAAKGVLGVGLGFAYLLMASATRRMGLKVGLLFSVLLCVGIFSLFWINDWWPLVRTAFLELDASGDRSFLYGAGLDASGSVVGRGPGAHILMNGEFYDAHQSILTAWLQGGALGIICFVLFFFWLGRRLVGSPALFGGFLAILVYAAGGDVLRRMPIWMGLFMMVWLAVAESPRRSDFRRSFDNRSANGWGG